MALQGLWASYLPFLVGAGGFDCCSHEHASDREEREERLLDVPVVRRDVQLIEQLRYGGDPSNSVSTDFS